MGEQTGFMKYERKEFLKEEVAQRIRHWKEFVQILPDEEMRLQAARCMDCGVPFCHWGCPLANFIPEWNDLISKGQWKEAFARLQLTNNFPEVTGRVCPAPCENSCVCSINQPAISIKNIELAIIEKAFREDWVKPKPPKNRTGKKIAIVGSGPAGLACADQLNKKGHSVTVYEKNEFLGGLLSLGIPDYKLEKWVLARRINLMREEGVIFKAGTHVGVDIRTKYLFKENNALVLASGAEWPRDLSIPGRELEGVYQAVRYLSQQNRINRGQMQGLDQAMTAKDKHVIVLGGGDTGADCVGTAIRQGAKSVKQIELLPRPPAERAADNPWPQWAFIYRKASSHEEGVEQDFSILTKRLEGENGKLKRLCAVRLEYGGKDPLTGRSPFQEIPNSEFAVECDMLILALGFLGPAKKEMIEELSLELDERSNVKTDKNFMTNIMGVFATGDMRRGQSLIVWAIDEGRRAAACVDKWLMT